MLVEKKKSKRQKKNKSELQKPFENIPGACFQMRSKNEICTRLMMPNAVAKSHLL